MTRAKAEPKSILEIVVALLGSIAFALSYGWSYGIDNQVVYMLGALRLVDPTILANDWFATKTTHYHFTFKYLAAALIALDRRGWAVGVAQTVVITAGAMCLFALVRALSPKGRVLPAFLLVLAVAFVTRTSGAAASYVFDIILQPSTLGSLALLASVPFFAHRRWVASGACVAVSGLFHANYLVLLILAVTFAHLALGREGLLGRLVLQLAFPSLVLLLFLPMILGTAASKDTAAAQNIYFNIRSPHHYVPGNSERDFIPFAAWQMIAAGASLHLLERDGRMRRVGAFCAGLLVLIWASLVMSTLVHVAPVNQLFSWRLGPHCELLLQVIAAVGAVDAFLEPGSGRRRSIATSALLATGLGFLAMYAGDHNKPALATLALSFAAAPLLAGVVSFALAMLAPTAWIAGFRRGWSRVGPAVALVAAASALIPVAIDQLGLIGKRSALLEGMRPDDAELYAWMRESTPKDAQFLTPPDVESMRYHGQRAIVVDWKSNPMIPAEVLDWYHRLEDVTGRHGLTSRRDLDGYNSMDRARLDRLRARYGLDFAVVRRGREGALGALPVAHQNRSYVVLDLRATR